MDRILRTKALWRVTTWNPRLVVLSNKKNNIKSSKSTFKCSNIECTTGAKRILAKVFGLYFLFRKKIITKKIVSYDRKKSTEDYSLGALNTYNFYKVVYNPVIQCLL